MEKFLMSWYEKFSVKYYVKMRNHRKVRFGVKCGEYLYLLFALEGHTKSLIKKIILEDTRTEKEDSVRVKFTLWTFPTFLSFLQMQYCSKIK